MIAELYTEAKGICFFILVIIFFFLKEKGALLLPNYIFKKKKI